MGNSHVGQELRRRPPHLRGCGRTCTGTWRSGQWGSSALAPQHSLARGQLFFWQHRFALHPAAATTPALLRSHGPLPTDCEGRSAQDPHPLAPLLMPMARDMGGFRAIPLVGWCLAAYGITAPPARPSAGYLLRPACSTNEVLALHTRRNSHRPGGRPHQHRGALLTHLRSSSSKQHSELQRATAPAGRANELWTRVSRDAPPGQPPAHRSRNSMWDDIMLCACRPAPT